MNEITINKPTTRARATDPVALREAMLNQTNAVLAGIEGTRDSCEFGDACSRVLRFAHREMANALDALKSRPLTSDFATSWMDDLYDIQSLIDGAAALAAGSPAGAVIQAPAKLIAQMLETLDNAHGLPEAAEAPPAPPSRPAPTNAASPEPGRTLGERRAHWVFGQIAGLADLAEELFNDVLECIPADCQAEARKAYSGRQVVAQINLLAFVGSQDVGGVPEFEKKDVREFLLPPAYHSETPKQET